MQGQGAERFIPQRAFFLACRGWLSGYVTPGQAGRGVMPFL